MHSKKKTIFGISHIGSRRLRNEDAIFCDPEGQFAILCDGMGGHKGGTIASHCLVSFTSNFLYTNLKKWILFHPNQVQERIWECMRLGSAYITKIGNDNPEFQNLGTTIVLLVTLGKFVYLGYIGDSRAYLFRNQHLFQVTYDHTFLNENLMLGLSLSEAKKLPFSNSLTQSVGQTSDEKPGQVLFFEDLKDDIWALTSDGLHNKVPTVVFSKLCSESNSTNLHETASKLVACAVSLGGEDNASIILVSAN